MPKESWTFKKIGEHKILLIKVEVNELFQRMARIYLQLYFNTKAFFSCITYQQI